MFSKFENEKHFFQLGVDKPKAASAEKRTDLAKQLSKYFDMKLVGEIFFDFVERISF
jgi:hypothetical protein